MRNRELLWLRCVLNSAHVSELKIGELCLSTGRWWVPRIWSCLRRDYVATGPLGEAVGMTSVRSSLHLWPCPQMMCGTRRDLEQLRHIVPVPGEH